MSLRTATVRRRLGPLVAVTLVALTALVGPLVAHRLPREMVVGFHVDLGGDLSLTRAPRVLAFTLLPGLSVLIAGGYLLGRRLDTRLDGGRYRRRLDLIATVALGVVLCLQCLLITSQL